MDTQEAQTEAERIKKRMALRVKKRFSQSKLDKYKPEILQLKNAGLSLEGIRIWLDEKHIKATRSTISRWLKAHEIQ